MLTVTQNKLKMNKIPYMDDIKDNYKKVYTKEGKFREWLEK